MQRAIVAAAAIALSAALWHFGTGLHPLPGLAFLAPLPVLLLAPRVGGPAAFLAGALAWLGGQAQMWSYFTVTLEQPAAFTVALLGGSALVFGALIALTRVLLLWHRPVLAALVVPAGWVTLEYVLSLAGSTGAWWSIAYTQADVLPFIQTAASTGVWGLTFLILLVPAAAAAVAAPATTRAQWIRVGGGLVVALTAVTAFGAWRLAAPYEREHVRVGLVAISQPPDYVPVDSPDGRDMVARAITEIERLADQGARAVVLPEKAWRADESTLPLLSGPLTEVAARRNVHVVAGLILTRGGTSVNAAIDFPSGVTYAKQYLVPGLENDLTPGTEFTLVPGEPWALAVCFDLDRPNLVRANQRRGATLLLVPALDFTDDHWLHSRMAVLRGVESGMGVARSAQLGELVAGDSRGRVLTSVRADISATATALADIPLTESRTIYARFGDWFAWLSVALFLLAALGAAPLRLRRSH
ncbi:nitrilase-related carbon-nitrogen hydrolase [Nocardia crassostreae]|uniref:nitrilase-related carbon-nitrogen hydrolase n=1 Tax=Nocardia crassostreae TaxID=53428 RepID=UPI00082D90F3|nr:nitrilase-related carbon-nitrogen hydrolase [Nocardia crassostreae]